MFVIFFFFSSRRRHTRCSRDWSSDVCSSDLTHLRRLGQLRLREVFESFNSQLVPSVLFDYERFSEMYRGAPAEEVATGLARSEERRVGKECRSRWWRRP